MKFLIKTNVHQDIASDKNLENLIHVKKKKKKPQPNNNVYSYNICHNANIKI